MDLQGYRTLRVKLACTTMAFSLIPLFALGLFIYTEFSSTYSEKITGNLRLIVDNKRKAIDMFLDERIAQLKTLAGTHSFKDISTPGRLESIFVSVQASSKSFIDLGVLDNDGRHAAYVGPYDLEGVNYSDSEWFHEVVCKGLYISDVFMGFRKYPHFIIAVTRREGSRTWILRATIDLEIFNSLVSSVQVGERGDAYLVNQANLLQTDSRFRGPALTKVGPAGLRRFSGARICEVRAGDKAFLAGKTWLETMGWMLVVLEDPSEAMSPLLSTHSYVLAIMLAGVAVIFTGALLTTNSIIGKIIRADQEKAALDASLMQSSKMAALGKLAAGIAHEVNNPLTLIRESAGWIKDLLTEEDAEAMQNYEEMGEVVDKIEMHVDRAKAVTHRMLGFARRMEPVHEKVDVNHVMDQSLQFLENETLYRNIVLKRDFDPDLPTITSDTAQIQQVVLNILENSIDAIDRDGTITVSTGNRTREGMVYFCIKDSGPGMAPEIVDKIFDPFFTTKKVGEGTGLGMAITYSIVRKLGGNISVDSRLGEGAVFTVCLPMGAETGT